MQISKWITRHVSVRVGVEKSTELAVPEEEAQSRYAGSSENGLLRVRIELLPKTKQLRADEQEDEECCRDPPDMESLRPLPGKQQSARNCPSDQQQNKWSLRHDRGGCKQTTGNEVAVAAQPAGLIEMIDCANDKRSQIGFHPNIVARNNDVLGGQQNNRSNHRDALVVMKLGKCIGVECGNLNKNNARQLIGPRRKTENLKRNGRQPK